MKAVDAERVRVVLRAALGLAPEAEVDGLTYDDEEAWTSIAHMDFAQRVDDEFDIMLDTNEVVDINSFKKAVEIIGRYVPDDDAS